MLWVSWFMFGYKKKKKKHQDEHVHDAFLIQEIINKSFTMP